MPNQERARILACGPDNVDPQSLRPAADALKHGRLVVFPTETVYGLGANALDPQAVAAIYAAKGRPARNPLIVHVASAEEASALVECWPAWADRLARALWPGPLSLVLPRRAVVPDTVTGAAATVAIRCPAHPVALGLIRASSVPIAAPSANPSGYVSPTRVEHLAPSILAAAAYVLDAGPCPGGIESTVVDATEVPLRILRPGLISPAEVQRIAGVPVTVTSATEEIAPRSPGLLGRHYAPRARVLLAATRAERDAYIAECERAHASVACLTLRDHESLPAWVHVVPMPPSHEEYARVLYDVLVRLDAQQVDAIVVDLPPDDVAWLAVRDRLRRAAIR